MKRLDYLKLALNNKICTQKDWIIKAFSLTRPDTTEITQPLQLIREPWGLAFLTGNEKIKIDDAPADEPLFKFKEKIQVDPSWAANIQQPITTSIGNLLVNRLCILSTFGSKMPFFTGRVSVKAVEAVVAQRLKDTPAEGEERSDQYFYVDEYVKFCDSLEMIRSLSMLCTWAATPKNVTAPTGIESFKQKLITGEFKDKLDDPVQLAAFEKKLKDYDSAYLKDDPSADTFISSKIKNVARKKMFLAIGADTGFEDNVQVTPILNSLDEGWPTDPVQFTTMMNSLRSGSYFRGAETVKGGVSAKIILRAVNNYQIVEDDCGSQLGIHRRYDATSIDKLIGRKVLINGKTLYIEDMEQARAYLNKELIVRSPMYCRAKGENICIYCAGKALAQHKSGIAIPLTEISSIILATSMSKMHGTVLSVVELDLEEAIS